MDQSNRKYVEAKIRRLTREIEEIDTFFYGVDDDPDLSAAMLQRKRDDIVRSGVLQLHTAIEDLLTSWITCQVLGVKVEDIRRKSRSKQAKALHRMLHGAGSMGFDMKLNFAAALGLINDPTKKKLNALNELRNKCSHNWLLKAPVRRGRGRNQTKPPLLRYKGHDLHKVSVFQDFTREYGLLYSKLYVKYIR